VSRGALHRPHTVTFDCWATLLRETESRRGPAARARLVAAAAGVEEERAREALAEAWRRHQTLWHRRVAFTGEHMTAFALERLGVSLSEARWRALLDALESEILGHDVRALSGAREALEGLAAAGVRRALICDTGFTPGRVVRQLLDRVGLLELLPVTVFSDEVGVPKPHPRAFAAALEGLGVGVRGAVHVGDLRRSDIAGARAAGMGSIRITLHNDDGEETLGPNAGVIDCGAAGCAPVCERPEADAVAATYPELLDRLGHVSGAAG
jgi:FMN phosphatase YigB (HAD superfamily)